MLRYPGLGLLGHICWGTFFLSFFSLPQLKILQTTMLFYHPTEAIKNSYTLSELDFLEHTYVPLLANIDHTWDMSNLIKMHTIRKLFERALF